MSGIETITVYRCEHCIASFGCKIADQRPSGLSVKYLDISVCTQPTRTTNPDDIACDKRELVTSEVRI